MPRDSEPDLEEDDPWDSKGRARRVREEDYWNCVQYLVAAGLFSAAAWWGFAVGESLGAGAMVVVAALCAFGAWRSRPGP
jgi:hypothetical protein